MRRLNGGKEIPYNPYLAISFTFGSLLLVSVSSIKLQNDYYGIVSNVLIRAIYTRKITRGLHKPRLTRDGNWTIHTSMAYLGREVPV